ncbi:DUF421 domain-containing protein [Fredinandcohnia sp. 179-A 10B2 NHS]|uniref:DUF421 domain-containing protein n=1 Tax=Fredinandcohnia sp. 179-A 10B2 NHS TaxID=3235176 RepID=UPI0039A1E270
MPNWVEVGIRSFSVIIGLFLIMKLLGKKQLGRLSFFEYILGITVGSIAADISMDIELDLASGITSILIWLLVPLAISLISLKSKKFSDFVEGKSTVFIKNGKILEDHLAKEKYTADELLEQLRKKRVFQIADVEFAALEPSGDISVLLNRNKQPLTFGDINSKPTKGGEPQTVIMDGEILEEPLNTIDLDKSWLEGELRTMGIKAEDIFLAQIDQNNQITVDLYDDQIIKPKQTEKQQLIDSIKKCKTEFEDYILRAESAEVKEIYSKHVNELNLIENSLTQINKNKT